MSAPETQPRNIFRGVVKQIISGESIVIRGQPKGGPPPEKTITLSSIKAPKLAKRATAGSEETKDEPWAWEAREFLRKKLVGESVTCVAAEKQPPGNRNYCSVYFKDEKGENMNEALVAEGLASVRGGGPEVAKLQELEAQAKAAGKGIWSTEDRSAHVRDIKWSIENMRNFVDKMGGKPIKAIIEHVRDGSTVRCFLLPDFYHITLMLSGIRCNGFKLDSEGRPDPSIKVEYAEEARYYVESRLLQREVEVVLDSVNNNNFVGTIIHPRGNIAELLLKEGFAKCVDWSIAFMKSGADKLRAAEREAKEKRLRLWKDYQSSTPQLSGKEKEFTGTVMEVVNGDALMIKLPSGQIKKVFLASIRPPRDPSGPAPTGDGSQPLAPRSKNFRPLYDIPWMYEAREFLRKKLIGKKVNVVVDYKQPPRDNFQEKTCCTVTLAGLNVAEAMVSKGLATVVKYRQDDDQRSSHYDALLAAEMKAQKSGKGLHAKKDTPSHRINDYSGDAQKAKQLLPHLRRGNRIESLVEFVASGSRLRLFIPKESCLITFLLAGINCQKAPRQIPGGKVEGDPFGEEALAFTKERCLQREVEITVESTDKAGNFIGWLWVENTNLSVALVQEGLAEVHSSAESSEFYRQLVNAEEAAKAAKLKMWQTYNPEEEKEKHEEEQVTERKVEPQKVFVIEATPDLHVFVQLEEQGPKLETMLAKLRQELETDPPLPGSYTPKRGDLCAAKFTEDNLWYRAKIEKASGGKAQVLYVDYGNRDEIPFSRLGQLPSAFAQDKYYAHEYALACVKLPQDPDYIQDAIEALRTDTMNKPILLNVEYRMASVPYVTLTDEATNNDIIEGLIKDGLLLVDTSKRDRRIQKLLQQYTKAQDEAKKAHIGVWQYGDITEDDDKEFGLGR
ncbi:staphylococcal nuclease domain-containing protein 1-like [Macrosteles quadrilineatus]|uniref:staphylococcal nuclease domain-containing protein 1-like n=1 Tax=Macrosteles quadrilineatus TaxID=74068 RepID=UPI0023E2E34D|nr:staphylococcal nuclease domain-containing protein 1-like [Macrosteles quadrilineatus]